MRLKFGRAVGADRLLRRVRVPGTRQPTEFLCLALAARVDHDIDDGNGGNDDRYYVYTEHDDHLDLDDDADNDDCGGNEDDDNDDHDDQRRS